MRLLNYISIFLILVGCFAETGEDTKDSLFENHKKTTETLKLSIPGDQIFKAGENIDFVLSFPAEMTVTGSPELPLDLDSGTRNAVYLDGSGSKSIRFRYLVQAGDNDADGIETANSISLAGGNIEYLKNSIATTIPLSFTSKDTSGLEVDTKAPTVLSITPPVPGKTYVQNEQLNFVVKFDEAVIADPATKLELDFEGNQRFATLVSGTGSSTLRFSYTVASGDRDTNGIELRTPLVAAAGDIRDAVGNSFDLSIPVTPMPGTYVNGDAPYIVSVTSPPNKTYYKDELISLTVEFSEEITITGTPTVTLNIGGVSRLASYLSGSGTKSIVFGYIVQSGDADGDGIVISDRVNLSGATLKNSANADAILSMTSPLTPNVRVDGSFPLITNITAPSDQNYITGELLDFTVEFDKSVNVVGTPRIELNLASGSIYADYFSGTGTNTLTFRSIVDSADQDNDGIEFGANQIDSNSGSITDSTTSVTASLLYNGLEPDMSLVQVNFLATPTHLSFTTQPSNSGSTISINPAIKVEIRQADGSVATSSSANVTLSIANDPNSGTASLSGTLTKAAVNGVATFENISIDQLGSGYTITATSGGLTPDTSSSFDITSVPTHLVFTTQPSDSLNSTNISPAIVVEVRDGTDSVVNTATDSVTIAFASDPSSGTATLAGTVTKAAVNGIVTFDDINIDVVNNGYSLAVSSGTLSGDTSNTFNITQAPATQLFFSVEPSDAELGQVIAPSIQVEFRDANDLLVPTETSSVSLAFNSDPSAGSATLGGTVTKAASGGIVIFDDISVDTLGIGYTLDATSAGITKDTSIAFDIAQIPTQLVITNHPSNTNNGFTISPSITIEIRDANNNLVANATDNVTLSFGNDSSGGNATISGTITKAAVSGIATFDDISIDTVASGYTFDFTSGSLSGATSTSFDITQAPATQVVFTQDPSNVEINNNIAPSITVEFRDANGILVPTESSNVSLAINNDPSSGAATLGGTLIQAAVNGIATFSDINLDTTGVGYTLSATSASLTSDVSTSFDVFRVPSQLVITSSPNDSESGNVISPSLVAEVRDINNVIVADATNTVTVSIANDPSGGSASLSGTVTLNAVAGVVNFNDLSLDTSGIGYTLNVSSAGLTAATSSQFDIFDTTLTFSPSTLLDFGDVTIGDSSDQTLLISHTGGTATPVTETTLSAPFSFKGGSYPGTGGTCGTSISSDCTVVVTYTPTSATTDNGLITINYNGKTTTRSLTGTGISITPTRLAVTGPNAVITNSCVGLTVKAVDTTGNAGNVSALENITLVINNGTGSFYSDAACTNAVTTTNITAGNSSRLIYFMSGTSAQNLTLIFNGTNLENTSKSVSTSVEPTFISANIPAEIIKDECTEGEISLVDSNGIKTGSSNSVTVNLTDNGDGIIYTDSFCTNAVTSVVFSAYEGIKTVYLKSPSVENVTFNFVDNASVLTSDSSTVDFVSNLTWWNTDYLKRVRISINNLDIPDTFTDMPVLVKLDSSKISYSDFLANGDDIRFTLDDHTTTLDYSIDTWNPSGTSYIWVKMDSVPANSQLNIYMYYSYNSATNGENGNSIWSSYDGVWLMNKNGGNYIDESGNASSGTANGTLIDIEGPVGNAISFNGSSTLRLTYDLSQTLGGTSTVSFWMKTSQTGNNTNYAAPALFGLSGVNAGQDLFYCYINASGRIGSSAGGGANVQSNFVVNDNTWRYVTVSRNQTTGEFRYYINGVLNGAGNSGTGAKTQPFFDFGATTKLWGDQVPYYYQGGFDSLRMSSLVLSDNRVKAEYKFTTDSHVQIAMPEDL